MGDTDGELDRLGSRVLESDVNKDATSNTEDDARRGEKKPRANPEAQGRRDFLPTRGIGARAGPRSTSTQYRVSQSDGETSDQIVFSALRSAPFVNRLGGFQPPGLASAAKPSSQRQEKRSPKKATAPPFTVPATTEKHPSLDDSEFDTDALALDGDAAATNFQPAPVMRRRSLSPVRKVSSETTNAVRPARGEYEKVPSPQRGHDALDEPETPVMMVSKISRRMETRVKTDWPKTPAEYMEKYTVMLSRITKMMEGPIEETQSSSVSTHLDIVCPVLRMRRHQHHETTPEDAMQYMFEALVVCDEIVLERYSVLMREWYKRQDEARAMAAAENNAHCDKNSIGSKQFTHVAKEQLGPHATYRLHQGASQSGRDESDANGLQFQARVQSTLASETEALPEQEKDGQESYHYPRDEDRVRSKSSRRRQMNVPQQAARSNHSHQYHSGTTHTRVEPPRRLHEGERRSSVDNRSAEYGRLQPNLQSEQNKRWWPWGS